MHVNFNRDFPKMTILEFQNLSSPTFFIQSSWNLILVVTEQRQFCGKMQKMSYVLKKFVYRYTTHLNQ